MYEKDFDPKDPHKMEFYKKSRGESTKFLQFKEAPNSQHFRKEKLPGAPRDYEPSIPR